MQLTGRGPSAPALLVFCACVGLASCARQLPGGQQAAAPDPVPLFERACARCHASDGSGGLPMATNGPRPIDLRDAVWQASRTNAEVISAIRDGRGAMPPFGDVLKADEIAALASHIRSFRGQAGPASTR